MKFNRTSKLKIFTIAALALCLALTVVAALFCACKKEDYPDAVFSKEYHSVSKVGYFAEYLGTVDRQHPEVSNGGQQAYPQYGKTLYARADSEEVDPNAAQKRAILDENSAMNAGAAYDSMDAAGNLYLKGAATGKKLYKHTASAGMYEGDVSDGEPAVIKKVTIASRLRGSHITGLYAPAGEVIKIEMSEEDLEATGGVTVYIGQVLASGNNNNIWIPREFNRMPLPVNAMTVKSTSGYVGSYLGGPIYIKPVNAGTTFSVTITGGVKYSHFILGYTTKEEFEENAKSSAPYFDLVIWDRGIRHSGPRARVSSYGYEDIYNAAVLWEKIQSVSTQIPSAANANCGIFFIYDPFIAAGAMVAFPGQNSVNCPLDTMTAALNYDGFTKGGSWGVVHEYNHCYQRYGYESLGGYPSETTNNAVSLISYSLFTKISSARNLEKANEGLSGWNRFTNASWALKHTLTGNTWGDGLNLSLYANLLHSFGQDAFIRAAKGGGGTADSWYKISSDAFGYDMTYFLKELYKQDISAEAVAEIAAKNYPMYVPVATIYQTGMGYEYGGGKVYFDTMQPYEIEEGKDFKIDLGNNIVLPEGFTYKIKKITNPEYGTLRAGENYVYTYTPDANHAESGKIYVTLSITKNDGAFAVNDVELVLGFRQGQLKPNVTERTVYTYSADTMYKGAEEAVSAGYAGYGTKTDEDNIYESGQNGNLQCWFPKENTVTEVRGKIYVSENGKYRISLRGRRFASLHLIADGQEKVITINNEDIKDHSAAVAAGKYADLDLKRGQWVDVKAVVLNGNASAGTYHYLSYVDVGLAKFNGESVGTPSTVNSAYRNSYNDEKFYTDYAYGKNYTATYSKSFANGTLVESSGFTPWDSSKDLNNLFDEDDSNNIHNNKSDISEENPFDITVDLGEEVRANAMTVYGVSNRKYQPKKFVLYGGTSLDNMAEICSVEKAVVTNGNVSVRFDEMAVRYYRFVCSETYAKDNGAGYAYIAFRCIKFSNTFAGVHLSPDDDTFTYRGGWRNKNAFSTFGHIYEGENAAVDFAFYGTQFAVYSLKSEDYSGFEVLIDGKRAGEADLNGQAAGAELAFLSSKLDEGYHNVTVRSKSRFNIDSFAIDFAEAPDIAESGGLNGFGKAIIAVGVILTAAAVGAAVLLIFLNNRGTAEAVAEPAAESKAEPEKKQVKAVTQAPEQETKPKPKIAAAKPVKQGTKTATDKAASKPVKQGTKTATEKTAEKNSKAGKPAAKKSAVNKTKNEKEK